MTDIYKGYLDVEEKEEAPAWQKTVAVGAALGLTIGVPSLLLLER